MGVQALSRKLAGHAESKEAGSRVRGLVKANIKWNIEVEGGIGISTEEEASPPPPISTRSQAHSSISSNFANEPQAPLRKAHSPDFEPRSRNR